MNSMTRPVATLLAAAAGGAGLWLAGHWDTNTNGGYWAVLGVLALAGLLIGVAQLRSPDGNAPGMFLVAWLPIAVVSAWVLVAVQPAANTYRDHVREWDNDAGLADVVHYLAPFTAVLAFGIGLVFGLTILAGTAMMLVRRQTVVAEPARVPATVPVTETTTGEPATVPATAATTEQATVPAGRAMTTDDSYDADAPTVAERREADASAEAEETQVVPRRRRGRRLLHR